MISAREARTRLDVEAEHGLTQFISRERELRLLMECFEQAKAGGGQVAFISGEPGIGKSRLLHDAQPPAANRRAMVSVRCSRRLAALLIRSHAI